ncbi:hypothetical protein [Streptacidiphilus fuscans]|uniref:Uncharacterized protein n=1 Tax=Streptacidiphilus fuscans TaxID=2789292 RepID=A0A931FFL5_9ACTN|nr:hypothetical protein [Streptacidiphilus fuscans]MBF9068524.1 hypothetical protein [Streptacidiphilus fuscans]
MVWIIVGLTTAGLLVLGGLAVLAYREVVVLAKALARSAERLAQAGADVERAADGVARSGGAALVATRAPSIQAPNGSA